MVAYSYQVEFIRAIIMANTNRSELVDAWIHRRKGRQQPRTSVGGSEERRSGLQPDPSQLGEQSGRQNSHGQLPSARPPTSTLVPAPPPSLASPPNLPAPVGLKQPTVPPLSRHTTTNAITLWHLALVALVLTASHASWLWFTNTSHNFTAIHIETNNGIASLSNASQVAVEQCCHSPDIDLSTVRVLLHDAAVSGRSAKAGASSAVDLLGSTVTQMSSRQISMRSSVSCSRAESIVSVLAKAADRSQAVAALHARSLSLTGEAIYYLNRAVDDVTQARDGLHADRKMTHTSIWQQAKLIIGISAEVSAEEVLGAYGGQKATINVLEQVRQHTLSASSVWEGERSRWHGVSGDLREIGRRLDSAINLTTQSSGSCVDSETYHELLEEMQAVLGKVAVDG
ncbi:hypothetical protein HBH98_172410 [Parastagonospora nodorum]|nr:hypothetical protein HBH53_245110 [Parastagonospora nodorum]KAH3961696.1 hypothetical protein HBH51_180330 [Parastagonospora nodorum]KAH4012818.1 hypothetical protein HBI09_221180 [Parastagonospora nodorum]KAH4163687.1 hypothetical protein HBH43_153830 [Parastagonospora nodorum]KAH4216403.1 hypothetical protein HBI06_231630 [Parastagonospora nodorum]